MKRRGLIVHGLLLAVLAAIVAWGLINLSRQTLGLEFAFYLLVSLVAFAPLPLVIYRGYALFRAQYVMNRDSLELRWGLRDESIPLTDIEWVRPIGDLTFPLRPPAAALPGALLGVRRHRDLGVVEFIASENSNMLLVATSKRVYAISPLHPAEFAQTFSRAVEMGSLTTTKPKSVYPSFVLAEAWRSGLVRYLWLAALFLNIGLIIWTSLLIPTLSQVTLAFGAARAGGAVPSTQLVILPLLSGFLSLTGWGAGLYYYRWEEERVLATAIWASSTLTSLLFIIAVFFIISTPV